MNYETAREILAEAIADQLDLDEATGTNIRRRLARMDHRLASLMGRAGASSDEIKDTIGGRRTPSAKSGRAKLASAERSARKKESKNMPNYPYGRKGLAEAIEAIEQLDEARQKTRAQRVVSLMARRDGRGGNINPDDIRQYYTHRRSLTPPEEAHRGRGLANDVIKWARTSHNFAKQREARRKGLIAKPNSVLAEAKSMKAKSHAMLSQIVNNMSDAMDKFREESALAKKHKADERRHNYHKDRAAHFESHVKNYEKHYYNAGMHHVAGDYHRAMSEGGYAANSKPHMKNIPSPHY